MSPTQEKKLEKKTLDLGKEVQNPEMEQNMKKILDPTESLKTTCITQQMT